MDTQNITITLYTSTLDELKNYAAAIGISTEKFIEDIIIEFTRFQQVEMDEFYLNDDGTHWLIPRD